MWYVQEHVLSINTPKYLANPFSFICSPLVYMSCMLFLFDISERGQDYIFLHLRRVCLHLAIHLYV